MASHDLRLPLTPDSDSSDSSHRRSSHRRFDGLARGLTAAGLTAAVAAAVIGATTSTASANDNDWYRLRMCESTNNYSINTGNGYYGAYQFDLGTWRSVGGSGYPNNASAAEQDYRARLLYRSRGWSPWSCARILNLQPDPSNGYIGSAPASKPKPSPAPKIATNAFAFDHSVLRLHGVAPKGSVVSVHYRTPWTAAAVAGTVRAGAHGEWSYRIGFMRDSRYWVTSSGLTSNVAVTKRLYRTSLTAPTGAGNGALYAVSGKTRPGRAVTLLGRGQGRSTFTARAVTHADKAGNYRFRQYATQDIALRVRGDVTTAAHTVRVQISATAAASIRRPATGTGSVVVHGTARPSSVVAVMAKHSGGAYVTTCRTTSGAKGGYACRIPAATDSAYYAHSSNGTKSPAKWVLVH